MRVLLILSILLYCLSSCNVPAFRSDDVFIIESKSKNQYYPVSSRYKYSYQMNYYNDGRFLDIFNLRSNENYEIGDTLILKLK